MIYYKNQVNGEKSVVIGLEDRRLDEPEDNLDIKPPKQLQTQDTKERIYNAAVMILKKKGYSYLTVSNICKVAHVSNGSFFYHFKTKDELFNNFTYNGFAEFRITHHFAEKVKDLPFDQRIICFYDAWADYMEETGIEFFSNFYNTKNYSLDIRLWNHRKPITVWNYPGECLQEAYDAGILSEAYSIDHYAEVLGTIIKGIAFDWCISNAAFDMHTRLQEVMVPYLESIKVKPVQTNLEQ